MKNGQGSTAGCSCLPGAPLRYSYTFHQHSAAAGSPACCPPPHQPNTHAASHLTTITTTTAPKHTHAPPPAAAGSPAFCPPPHRPPPTAAGSPAASAAAGRGCRSPRGLQACSSRARSAPASCTPVRMRVRVCVHSCTYARACVSI